MGYLLMAAGLMLCLLPIIKNLSKINRLESSAAELAVAFNRLRERTEALEGKTRDIETLSEKLAELEESGDIDFDKAMQRALDGLSGYSIETARRAVHNE